ncbi:hypothetical protein OAX11_02770 [Flavobacteriaceae bacterium]|nr:hypothetical protein [Flavobacteriaceae bacterium]
MKLLRKIKTLKTTLLVIIVFGGILISTNFFANSILLNILNKNPDRVYQFESEKINFSLLKQSISITDITVHKKENQEDKSSVLQATIEKITIQGFNVYELLTKQRIVANKLFIKKPHLDIISTKKEKRTADNSKTINLFWQDLTKNILIKHIEISNGELQVYRNEEKEKGFYTKNINLNLKNVRLNNTKNNSPLPFLYSDISLKMGETYAKVSDLYQVEISSFSTTNSTLSINDIKINPTLSRKVFNQQIKTEQDYTSCLIDHIQLKNTNWKFYNDTVFVKAENLLIHKLETILYRNKYVRDNLSKKKLYSQVLRDLPFYINIDSFSVREGALTYQELQKNKNNYGEINFKSINLKGTHLNNYNYEKDSISTNIKFKALLFGKSPITTNFSFKVSDVFDRYKMKGTLLNLNTADLNILTKPMFNIRTKGHIHKLDFLINGSDYDASAVTNMVYQDLKLIYGKDKGTHKLLNRIVNLVVKKNQTSEEAKNVQVYVKRNQKKSMYNQIIKCFVESLKKTLI